MAEAALMGFQSQEYARASVMYSDLELACQLQLNEALAASAAMHGAASSSGGGGELDARRKPEQRGVGEGDRAMACLLQSGELRTLEQQLIDQEKARKAGQRMVVEIRQRWHDKEFARQISEMSDDEWEETGDQFEKPFMTGAASNVDDDDWDEDQVCTLFFARAREDPGYVGMAWAMTDDAGHVLFQQSKYLGLGISGYAADYTALINGLAYARSAGVKNILANGDSSLVSNQVSGMWRAHTPQHVKYLEQVQEYARDLDSFTVHTVPKTKNRYVLNLARQAIKAHVASLTKGGVENQIPPQATVQDLGEDCPICFERRREVEMFHVRSCAHKFCLDCLSQHVEVQVKANQVPVRCPLDCSDHLELDQCQPFLPPKILDSFVKCLTEASIPEADRVYCPFPNCSALMSKGGLNVAVVGSSSSHPHATAIGRCECMECHRLFCVECQVPWHTNLSCADYQELPPDGRDAEDIKLHQLASHKRWQRCKKCRCMIELDHGCYHMTCRCGHEFCYTCGAEWKNKQATCKCKLWDENNIIHDESDEEEQNDYDDDDEEEEFEPRFAGNLLYKTRICRHWEHGFCWFGEDCTFAHGQDELRRVGPHRL